MKSGAAIWQGILTRIWIALRTLPVAALNCLVQDRGAGRNSKVGGEVKILTLRLCTTYASRWDLRWLVLMLCVTLSTRRWQPIPSSIRIKLPHRHCSRPMDLLPAPVKAFKHLFPMWNLRRRIRQRAREQDIANQQRPVVEETSFTGQKMRTVIPFR